MLAHRLGDAIERGVVELGEERKSAQAIASAHDALATAIVGEIVADQPFEGIGVEGIQLGRAPERDAHRCISTGTLEQANLAKPVATDKRGTPPPPARIAPPELHLGSKCGNLVDTVVFTLTLD